MDTKKHSIMTRLMKKASPDNVSFIALLLIVLPLISWQQKENLNSKVEYNQKQIESLSSRVVQSQTYREIQVALKQMTTEVRNERLRQGKPKLKISESKVHELNNNKNLTIQQKREELAKMGVVVSDEYIKLSTETVPKLYNKLYSEFPEIKTLSENSKQAVLTQARISYNKISFN